MVKKVSAIFDNTAPAQVGAVGVPGDDTYAIGEDLVFVVTFNENVVVDTTGGTPHLAITLDSGSVEAAYQPATDTDTMSFVYQVQEGDNDEDGIEVAAGMVLNGATVKDAAGNAVPDATLAALTLPASTTGILVEGALPTLDQVVGTAATYLLGEEITLTATFSEPVTVGTTGVNPVKLRLRLDDGTFVEASYDGDGLLSATHNFSYTVADGDLDDDGPEVTRLYFNGNQIASEKGNAMTTETLNTPLSVADVVLEGEIPTLTGLADNPNPLEQISWAWGCTDHSTPCTYRHKVNQDSNSYTFPGDHAYGSDTSEELPNAEISLPATTTTYYLHVQVKDDAGNESQVETFLAKLSPFSPPIVAMVNTEGTHYRPLLSITNVGNGDKIKVYRDAAV